MTPITDIPRFPVKLGTPKLDDIDRALRLRGDENPADLEVISRNIWQFFRNVAYSLGFISRSIETDIGCKLDTGNLVDNTSVSGSVLVGWGLVTVDDAGYTGTYYVPIYTITTGAYFLLLESGDDVLLETGDKILLD